MSCTKALSFAVTQQDYPLDEAVYVPSVDKILATMGTYVLKFNATTAALEASARVGPGYGPCHICYHALTDSCYVSIWNAQADQYATITRPTRDIFPVNPLTLEIGARFGLDGKLYQAAAAYPAVGPRFMKSVDHYIYFIAYIDGLTYICRIDPANLTDYWNYATVYHHDDYMMEQFGADATNIYFPMMDYTAMVYFEQGDYTTWDFVRPSAAHRPDCPIVAVEYCPTTTKPYGVSGNKYMLRADDFSANGWTKIDISSVADPNPKPLRIRYRSTNGFLYLPSASSDCITVWDPNTETVSDVKTGFDSPWDVVFTPSKAFAVQKGPVGLKEIT